MTPSTSTTSLYPSHPLLQELTSLRQQLHQYQRSSHQTSIQLQGSRLELSLLKEDNAVLREACEGLKAEVEILRTTPDPPISQPSSTALSELSLAHRRLSSKLDLTESQLTSVQLELAASKQEVTRLVKDKEGLQAVINDLRRVEEDREEEVEWERGERRKMEEQKKLCELALSEYSNLVHSLDPSAVPPAVPSKESTTNILNMTPELTVPLPASPGTLTPASSSETISNLLIGQRGVHRLFQDFTSTLTTKEREIHRLSAKIEELEHTITSFEQQLKDETEARISSEADRDKVLRDDASAAKVVERYMSFSQKNAQTLHSHLNNLRDRSSATQTTLRKETVALRNRLRIEGERCERLRGAMDEMSEGLSREAAGRRREIALRLKMISDEERRERKVEKWLDKVRLARDGADGAVLEADTLESLIDEGIDALDLKAEGRGIGLTKEKLSTWGRKFLTGKKTKLPPVPAGEESSIARVLLAEDLVTTLVQDLQIETERRVELERQRVDWLAKDAENGVDIDQTGQEVMFDAEDDVDHLESPETPGLVTPSTPDPSPLLTELKELFEPLRVRYDPLQKKLHDLSSSLSSLRSSLPALPDTIPSPTRTKKSAFLHLSRKSTLSLPPSSDPALQTLLDGIHEVIEDARVDVEIEMADNERVYHGFEALLGVGGEDGLVQKGGVMKDVKEYVEEKSDGSGYRKLNKRIEDLEHDLSLLKMTLHEVDTLPVEEAEEVEDAEMSPTDLPKRKGSVWQTLPLRTVTISLKSPSSNHTPTFPNNSDTANLDPRKRTASLFTSVGRSFSSSVIGAPRRVSGLANGLYRKGENGSGSMSREGVEKDSLLSRDGGDAGSEDDVE